MGDVVRGRDERSRSEGGGGSAKKNDENEPKDHGLGRSRGGWGSKLHLVTDGKGVPLSAVVTAGQAHESKSFEMVMESVKRPRGVDWPRKVAGDKGYSYPSVARWLANREIVSVIPQRSDQIKRNGKAPLDKRAYRRRSVIERCVNWLKENRHFSTRYDKLAVNFMGFVTLAFIRRYLRLLHPSDTP